MEYIAHRGVVKESIVENTKNAFLEAIINPNFIGFELDVRVSKDGVFVVYHDSLIDGKLIRSLTYQELKYKGVMRLKDVLRLETDKLIIIEIKSFDMDLSKLNKMINKSKRNIYVMSFSNKVIKLISCFKRNYKVGTLNYIINSEDDYSYNDFICLLYFSITDNIIKYFKEHNIEVLIYGVSNNIIMKDYGLKVIVDYDYVKKFKN